MNHSAYRPERPLRSPATCHAHRGGFSLMELFLVIAILSVLTWVSWPLLSRPLNKSRVQDAAQQLQRDLGEARLRAVESGQVLLFQFRPGTGTYYVGGTRQSGRLDPSGTLARVPAPSKSNAPDPVADPQDDSTVESEESPDQALKELPVGTFFARDDSVRKELDPTPRDPRGTGDSDFQENRADAASAGDDIAWSPPVRFYPSGRSSPAQVTLGSEQGYIADVLIQGLAGRVKISPIHR